MELTRLFEPAGSRRHGLSSIFKRRGNLTTVSVSNLQTSKFSSDTVSLRRRWLCRERSHCRSTHLESTLPNSQIPLMLAGLYLASETNPAENLLPRHDFLRLRTGEGGDGRVPGIYGRTRRAFYRMRTLVCADDAEAIDKAKRLVDGHDVELWSGERLVTRLKAKAK
jgi:hypothetical protein